jgi:hypothetical protein
MTVGAHRWNQTFSSRYGYKLPESLLDDNNLPAITDWNESSNGWGGFAHGHTGAVNWTTDLAGVSAKAAGSESCNITYLDGGGKW